MRTLLLGLVAVAALALAGMASAGGWATAGVNQPPDDPTAGSTWDAKISILQHGQTPLAGVSPTLTLIGEGGKRVTFPAKPTDETGVYVASVKFPSAGSWSYEVYDGFTQYGGATTHTFAPVSIGTGAGDGGGFPFLTATAVIGLLLALLATGYLLARRIRIRHTAPSA